MYRLPDSVRRASFGASFARLLVTGFLALAVLPVAAQEGSSIPDEYRGDEDWIARGILDGNLIETNFRNHGELSRWSDLPWGVWPRGIGGRHIDGIGLLVAGRVPGERAKWPSYGGLADTLVNPVLLTYRDAGKRLGPDGTLWGWLPLSGFHNPDRINRLGEREPTPALSDDPSSWPQFWPDRLENPDDPGWGGQWNGFFGRGVFNADLESFYVVDDYSDKEYHLDPDTGLPLSQFGVFYPDAADSTKGGLALQSTVRLFQWANLLAEDTMFILYRITNTGSFDYRFNLAGDEGIFFAQIMDYGLGNEEGDENAAFDPQVDITYGWDQDGIGQRTDGTLYDLGYTGFAFLESPARPNDGLDNDEDGIADEQRFGGAGDRIEGQDAIAAAVNSRYDMINFERVYGALEDRPAYRRGVWWTGDENLDWVGFEDANENGVYDSGEQVFSDVGRDGKGPFDLNYPGPDDGEADGMPTPGEPAFDELDVDESDQIGLTGYDLNARPFYESGDNLRDDTWLFDRVLNFAQFPLGTAPAAETADVEPFLMYVSGPVSLAPNQTDFFSTAWLFGEDENDFFKNRRTVQSIYDNDYNFAQPPFTPTLTAVPGDGRVTLTWDTLAVASFDRFTQEFDFEGYRLYKGTDPLLSDSRLISDLNGTPTFYKPIAQWDLDNGLRGPVTVLGGESVYNLGSDSGLSYFYIDEDVTNGLTYYYALVAYDRGVYADDGTTEFDPQENVFNISVDLAGNVVGVSQNAAIVIPRSRPAGLVDAATNEDLSKPTEGIGSGSIDVRIVVPDLVKPENPYQMRFFSGPSDVPGNDLYDTVAYELYDAGTGQTVISRSPLVGVTPMIDGFVVEINNFEVIPNQITYDLDRTGFLANPGTANEIYGLDPRSLDGYDSNWVVDVKRDSTTLFTHSPFDYELVWVNPADSVYTPPRFGFTFLRDDYPFFARNATTGETIDLFVEDKNRSQDFDSGDEIIIVESEGRTRKFRYRVKVNIPEGENSNPPEPGQSLRITTLKEFFDGDMFQFTIRDSFIDPEIAKSELDDIAVVPNPYVGASGYEQRSQISGRGDRLIRFTNLPRTCTISIFNIRGELVKTLRHDGVGSDGALFWDMKTEGLQDIAYGVYIYHVKAEGIGEHVGKFAVIK
ncbi:MAG: hypothetical protein JJ896_10215 [Rhodothermales bacterium]|nr:hypothetical protein [Rhodothermales bacterium]MBO6780014.1 hypothetical protein [Rhodothermales bacterium]